MVKDIVTIYVIRVYLNNLDAESQSGTPHNIRPFVIQYNTSFLNKVDYTSWSFPFLNPWT